MNIRLANADDLPAILEITNWAAANTAANFATEPETLGEWIEKYETTCEFYPWFVAVDADAGEAGGGRVAGVTKGAPWKARGAYRWTAEVTVYVHPDDHGRGVGRALYLRLITTMIAQGYHTLLGGITLPNDASVRLHESLGFRRVAVLEQVGWKFEKWHDVSYWELNPSDNAGSPAEIRRVRDVADA